MHLLFDAFSSFFTGDSSAVSVYFVYNRHNHDRKELIMGNYVISLDQGTTSSRAIIFDKNAEIIARAQMPFRQIYPRPGWVEHDPEEILDTQLRVLTEAFQQSGLSLSDIAGIGITNQRETTIVWNKHTGKPVCNAIVWQCRRTAAECDRLIAEGFDEYVKGKTGLLIDAYFSATKIAWILDNVPDARRQAEQGDLLFGTVDTWLIWNLTGGRAHVTDYSNASRTMLFDIHNLTWDDRLCEMLNIPGIILPHPVSNSQIYGHISGDRIPSLTKLEGIPVCGSAGDQQAALFGQACFTPGDIKNTYGTGCFTLMNTGSSAVRSKNGLVSSVAWVLGEDKKPVYALEGSVFNGGSTIQWIRDELGLISSSPECDVLAAEVPDSGGVVIVPAFTGLGAPYWDMYARGTITGLTRGTNKRHIARAVLESIVFQVSDLIHAMSEDSSRPLTVLRADGGASVSDLMMQFQADMLNIPVDRPACVETSALGAAYLAGLASGVWKDTDEIAALRRTEKIFAPDCSEKFRREHLSRWHRAVNCAAGWESES